MSGNAAAVLTKPGFRKIEWPKRAALVEKLYADHPGEEIIILN